MELAVDETVAFDNAQQAKFKTAILRAAGRARSGGTDGAGAAEVADQEAESLVAINRLSRTSAFRGSESVSAVRIEYYIDAELEYEVQAMRSMLTFDSVQSALAQVGLEALPPRAAAPAPKKRNKEGRFPAELKKGVKAACASDPEAYRHFVSLCTDYAHNSLREGARKQALNEMRKLLLATPLAQEAELKQIRHLLQLFREWTRVIKPSTPATQAGDGGRAGKTQHNAACAMTQVACFLCDRGQQHCVCCNQMRQLSLLRSLQHTCSAADGCGCSFESRRERLVRGSEKAKLVEAGVKEADAESILDKLELDFGSLYPLSDSAGFGSLVVHPKCANGHRDWVRAVACHPQNSDVVASGSDDATIKLWSLTRSRCIATVQHAGGVQGLAWSPCGAALASGSADASTRVWLLNPALMSGDDAGALQPGEKAIVLRSAMRDHRLHVSCVAWGGWGGEDGAAEKGVQEGREEGLGSRGVGRVWLATGSRDHTILLYRYEHIEWGVFALQRAALEQRMAVARARLDACEKEHVVAVRELNYCLRARERARDSLEETQESLANLERGEGAQAKKDEARAESEVAEARQEAEDAEEEYVLAEAKESEASQALDAARAERSAAQTAFDAPSGAVLCAVLRAHADFVTSLAFSPPRALGAGSRLASASCDCTVRLWHLSEELRDNPGEQPAAAAAAAAAGGGQNCVEALVSRDAVQEVVDAQVFVGHSERVWCVAFAGEGHLLASCSEDCTVRLWNPEAPDGRFPPGGQGDRAGRGGRAIWRGCGWGIRACTTGRMGASVLSSPPPRWRTA